MTDELKPAQADALLAAFQTLKAALKQDCACCPKATRTDDLGARELAFHALKILAQVGSILNNPHGSQEAGAAILNALEELPPDIKGELNGSR